MKKKIEGEAEIIPQMEKENEKETEREKRVERKLNNQKERER